MAIETLGTTTPLPGSPSLQEQIKIAFLEVVENKPTDSDQLQAFNSKLDTVATALSQKISKAIDDYIKSMTVTVTVSPGISVSAPGGVGATTGTGWL